MASLEEGRVVACRPGSIADDSESDEEDDKAGDDSRFWLCVVVCKCGVSPTNQTVKNTQVQKGEKYMVIRWLEKISDDELKYELSDVEDCISGRSVEGLLVVKQLGKINRIPPLTNETNKKRERTIKYSLHKDNLARILAVLPRHCN